MRNTYTALAATLAIGSCCAIGPALASPSAYNPAGIYVGAGIGSSNVRNDGYYSSNYYGFDNRNTAWQLTAGIRPISIFGVEYDYMNFGSPDSTYGPYYTSGNSSTYANALFGVGYLPLPLPMLDVYGKLGIARLYNSATVYGPGAPFYQNTTNSDFAYGVGTQVKFGNLAVRAEFERISESSGSPDMLSVGVNFTF
jgi:opacity protein-like surface antigen